MAQRRRRSNGQGLKHAVQRPKKAGFRVRSAKCKTPFRPLDVKGLDLSRALDEARGKCASL